MRLTLLLLSALAFVGCQNVPITGRSQFILVDESEVVSMSASEFSKMKKLPGDKRLASRAHTAVHGVEVPDDLMAVLTSYVEPR